MESNLKNYEGEGMGTKDEKSNPLLQIEKDANYILNLQTEILDRLFKINDFLFNPTREGTPPEITEKEPDRGKLNTMSSKLGFCKERIAKISSELDILSQLLP